MRIDRNWRQRGDTIVEVMIVLAVLGSAISISYATANRSLRNARQAQDSSFATSLAQAQIEYLRANANVEPSTPVGPNPNYIYGSQVFCFDTAGNLVKFSATVTPAQRTDNAVYPPACVTSHSQDFRTSIVYLTSGSDSKFEVKVYWDDGVQQPTGTPGVTVSKASTTLIYRVHPES